MMPPHYHVPPGRPTTHEQRVLYETGSASRAPIAGFPPFEAIPAANAWESASMVFAGACVLEALDVAVDTAAAAAVYVLGYDMTPGNSMDALGNAIAANALGAARYTWGPITPGGILTREPLEVHRMPCGETVLGFPFDTGVLLVQSTTPGVSTFAAAATMRVTARVAVWR